MLHYLKPKLSLFPVNPAPLNRLSNNPCLAPDAHGFSLIEVVLSLGIVSFALLAIFALFGSSLRSASETVSQNEVLGITRSLSDFLGSSSAGYGTVSNWVSSSTDPDPNLFAFIMTNGVVSNGFSTNTNFSSAANSLASRTGRLFKIVPTLSQNVPSITNAEDLSNHAFIPLQVKIYAVPTLTTPITNLVPVFIYETSVFR
jgi:Tfp pilus assembly protein PilV